MVKSMSNTIKLFQSARVSLESMGIYKLNQSPSIFFWNSKSLAVFAFLAQICLSSMGFFLFGAETIAEYGFAFYTYVSQLFTIYIFFVLMFQMLNIIKLIGRFEEFIENGKYI